MIDITTFIIVAYITKQIIIYIIRDKRVIRNEFTQRIREVK